MGFLRPIVSFGIGLVMIITISAIFLSVLSFCSSVMRVYDPLG